MSEYEYTQQDTQAHLNGMKDVSDLVYQLISGEYIINRLNVDTLAVVMKRQIDHLNLMLGMDHIQNSGADLTYFEKARDDGNAWLQNNQ